MKAIIVTDCPEPVDRLRSALAARGHEVGLRSTRSTFGGSTAPEPRLYPSGMQEDGDRGDVVAGRPDIVILGVDAGSGDPRATLASLRGRFGDKVLSVGLVDAGDARIRGMLEAGFEESWNPEDGDLAMRVLGWENLLRWNVEALDRATAKHSENADADGDLFRTALRGTNTFIFRVGRDLRVSWVGTHRPGFTVRSFLGRRLSEVVGAQDVRELEAALREVLDTKQPIVREIRSRIFDRVRRQKVHAVPLHGKDGEVAAVVAASFDITELRTLQEELERVQRQYRLLERLAPDMIWSYRSPAEPEYMNPRWKEFTGLELADLAPDSWMRFIHPDDIPGLEKVWAQAWEGKGPFGYEMRMKGRDGVYRWFWARAAPELGLDGKVERLVGVSSDIDERKRIEEAMRESEERFRDLANNMSQLAWIADPTGSSYWANQRWIDYTGVAIEDARQKGWAPVHHPDHVERVLAEFDRCLKTGEPWEDTFPLRGRDGRYRWFLSRAVPIRSAEGRIVRWLGTNTDITESREAAERAERSRAQFEAVFQSVQDGIVVTDLQGNFLFVNDAEARIAGFSSAEEMKRGLAYFAEVFELAEPDGTPIPLERWPISRILRGETIADWLLRGRRRDTGQEWHFVYSGKPVRDERGDIILALVVTRDVTQQVKAEEALREQTALLQAIRDTSSDLIFAKDRSGRMLMANPSTLAMLGKEESEVIGKTDAEFLGDPQGARVVMENDKRIMEQGRTESVEEELRGADGVRRIWLSTKSPYRDTQGTVIGLLGISRDITERKRTEASVRQERELLTKLIDRLPVLIAIFDPSTGAYRFNEEFRRVLGWGEEDAARGEMHSLGIPDPAVRGQIRKWMEDPPPGWHEIHLRSKDGEDIPSSWAYLMADETRLAIGIDLRARKRAEEALRRSEEKFRALAESLPQIVWTAEPDGTVDYYNRRWAEYSGTAVESGHGWGWAPVVHPDDEQTTMEAWIGAVRTGSVYVCEHRLRRHDAAFRWFLSRGVPMKDSEGRVLKWFGTATDIDDQKRAQEELRRARDELEERVHERTAELERQARELGRSNDELRQFAHVASHDLQEPLRMVTSYAQLIADRYTGRLDPDADEFIGFLVDGARRMSSLIQDLLGYSTIGSEQPRLQSTDLRECVRKALESLRVEIVRHGAEIAVGSLPTLHLDQYLITQMFINLIGNSLKFRGATPPRIEIGSERHGEEWIVRVRDNGIGIAPEYHQRVFQAFQRLHRWEEIPGSGIGLSICRRIAERHGGRIWVEPAVGGGSTFLIAFPGVTPGAGEPIGDARHGTGVETSAAGPRPPAAGDAGMAASDAE